METVPLPRSVAVRLSHAALQVLAEDHDVDLLHIKGPAVDDSLGGATRASFDADVLVRPAHVDRLIAAMREHGWTTAYGFEDGSAFEHASTLVHSHLAHVDVHRQFPGFAGGAGAVFERLWADRHLTDVAGTPCAVPSLEAQRLLLIIHAARGGDLLHPDIARCWYGASAEEQVRVQRLADELHAEMALGAGTGRLGEYRGERGYELWHALSTGERSLVKLWFARVRAEPTTARAIRRGVRLVLPNRRRMQETLGRRPTTGEVLAAYADRARQGLAAVAGLVAASGRRARGER